MVLEVSLRLINSKLDLDVSRTASEKTGAMEKARHGGEPDRSSDWGLICDPGGREISQR
jgi:hypothetical protein